MRSGFNFFRCGFFGSIGVVAYLTGGQPKPTGALLGIVIILAVIFSACLIIGAAKFYVGVREEQLKQSQKLKTRKS